MSNTLAVFLAIFLGITVAVFFYALGVREGIRWTLLHISQIANSKGDDQGAEPDDRYVNQDPDLPSSSRP